MSAETLAAKSARLAPFCVYGVVRGRTDLLTIRCLHEEASQEEHVMTLQPDGTVTCDCWGFRSHGGCYHPGTLATDEAYRSEREAFADLARSALEPTPEPVKQTRAPRPGDKAFRADWGA